MFLHKHSILEIKRATAILPGRSHPCVTRRNAASVSGFSSPTERQSGRRHMLQTHSPYSWFLLYHKCVRGNHLEFSHGSYLVCRARGKDELAVRVKWQTVDLRRVGIYRMAGFGGVVRSSVPTEEKNDIPQRFSHNFSAEHLPVTFDFITTPFTSWASGHLRQIQRVTREASARKRLQPLQCDRWRWSLHPLPSPPLAQHWCPTDRRSTWDQERWRKTQHD